MHKFRRIQIVLCALILGIAIAGIGISQVVPTTQPFEALNIADIPNVHRVTPKIFAGAAPETEHAFKELADMGIKTIISVDGATPDVERAKKFGLRYVHLPIGYDDVSKEEGLNLAKAMEELPGPIYVHCHHGKHRSAAAVAVACVVNGTLEAARAEDLLRTFGTGANYLGLWQSAREARPITEAQLDEIHVKYVEKATIPALAQVMVYVDERSENLKAIEAAGWKTPANHPDLDPPHEALQLQELLVELGRSDQVKDRPQHFHDLLSHAATAADNLRAALAAEHPSTGAIETAYKLVNASCIACHHEYRDEIRVTSR